MKIGVGVEGPSDRQFWNMVLHKHFPGVRFDIRNMKGKGKLIRETPRLLDTFRSLHYAAGFILVDRDKDPCIADVRQRFDEVSREEARKPKNERYLLICVAIRELEAWFLADAAAINVLLLDAAYNAPEETAVLGAEGRLRALWQQQYGRNSTRNKTDFAKRTAPRFDPEAAGQHQASFTYFWSRLTAACQGALRS